METEKDKQIAIITYFTIIGCVIAMVMNNEKKNPFASFHIRQSLGVFLLFFALGYPVSYFDSWAATMGFYLFFFILWIYGFLGALQKEYRTVPLVGNLFQKLFKGI